MKDLGHHVVGLFGGGQFHCLQLTLFFVLAPNGIVYIEIRHNELCFFVC